MSARVHQQAALQHNAIFYDAPADLTTTAVDFVREGLEAGEVVLVNSGSNPVTETLAAAFGDEKRVVFAESPVYGRPVSVIDVYQRIMDRGLAAGVREPGRSPMSDHEMAATDPAEMPTRVPAETAATTAVETGNERVDAVVPGGALTLELAEELERLGPFGAANPAPRLLVPAAGIEHVMIRDSVVLPQPDSPTRPSVVRSGIDRLTSSTALTSVPDGSL